MNHEPLRYAHEPGHTDVCFSSDGSKFITCGADGDIRVWSTQEGEDPTHNCVGDWALSVRQKGANLYVATSSNDVQILTFPEGERNGVLDRFVAPINQITVSKDSEHIALAGEDMEVKLIDLGKQSAGVQIFAGLTGPCLSVALNSRFLAASCGDGKLRIWDIENKDLLKEIDCFPKTNSFANTELLCRVDFELNGKFLAYPDKNTVILLNTTDWEQSVTLACSDVTANFSIVQFSTCGKYLVATTCEGDFVIFSVEMETVCGKSKHPNATAICGLMWNPSENGQIVYTDTEGQLGIMSECIIKNSSALPDDVFTDNGVNFGDIQFEDDDDDDENDECVVSVEKLKKQIMGDTESELNFDARSSEVPSPRPKTPEIPLQPPFMPSSTPEHLNPRYLCWNEVGIIRSYGAMTDDDSGKSIEIEFHNSGFHNSMMLQNYQEYIMGTISKAAVAVASARQLYVIPLNASSKEWVLKLDDTSEEIVLIGSSERLICFGSSNYLVRICSIFGSQLAVISIPGPLVTMSCYQNSLLVAYHSGTLRKNDQNINIKLIKFTGLSMESRDINAALGPESTLSWVGFSDVGTPAMMDSLGMLSLHPISCNLWIPFCDTTKEFKSPSDNFFVTAVEESHQTLMGIKCRGTVYPSFTPKPTIAELKLEPPFAESTTDKTQLEMNLFSWSNLQVGDVDSRFTETGLKTFALACKNDLDQRAVELMEIVAKPHLLNLCTKYAMKLHKKLLAEKLMELAAKLTNEDDDAAGFRSPSAASIKLSNKKLTLSAVKRTPKSREHSLISNSEPSQDSQNGDLSPALTLDESFASEGGKNPFLKNSKCPGELPTNPLSLVNKFAGVDYIDAKENKTKNVEVAEKRKHPDSESDKQREKQRKLDRFMFTKRS